MRLYWCPGVWQCLCWARAVFSLSAPGPGLPSHKVPQLWTGHCTTAGSTGDSAANIYGRQLVINWMVAEMPS